MLCQLLLILFRLISLQSTRFVPIPVKTTAQLLSVYFVTILKLFRPTIHTSDWIQYSTPGLFFLCEWKYVYWLVRFPFRATFLLALFLKLCPSLHIQVPNFELISLLEFIFVVENVDLWTLILSTDYHYFCLFQFQPFLSAFFFNNL